MREKNYKLPGQVIGALTHGNRYRWEEAPFGQVLNACGGFIATEITENTEDTGGNPSTNHSLPIYRPPITTPPFHHSPLTHKSARRAPSLALTPDSNTAYAPPVAEGN